LEAGLVPALDSLCRFFETPDIFSTPSTQGTLPLFKGKGRGWGYLPLLPLDNLSKSTIIHSEYSEKQSSLIIIGDVS
jgi:hypothetical protein